MTDTHDCKTIKIAFMGDTDEESNVMRQFFNDTLITRCKAFSKFSFKTDVISDLSVVNDHNFLFYPVSKDSLNEVNTLFSRIKTIASRQKEDKYLIIVFTDCEEMEIDEDDVLIFSDEKMEKNFSTLESNIQEEITSKCYLFKICMKVSNVLLKIEEDEGSLSNLSEDDVDLLAKKFLKKSSKLSFQDKKRELKSRFKSSKLKDEMEVVGLIEIIESVCSYFKLAPQKKCVMNNYLTEINKITLFKDFPQLETLYDEIKSIDYMKEDMYNMMIQKSDTIILEKMNEFFKSHKDNLSLDRMNRSLKSVDIYEYHAQLVRIEQFSTMRDSLKDTLKDSLELEITRVNKIIIDHYNQEMEKMTDLDKIVSVLEIFSKKDKKSLLGIFEKVYNHPKIISENMNNSKNWLVFFEKCEQYMIPKEEIVRMYEKIIMTKIDYYCEMSNSKSIEVAYPQALNVFLLCNLNNFILKRIYMYLTCCIRYSNRNLPALTKSMKEEEFNQLLILETGLIKILN